MGCIIYVHGTLKYMYNTRSSLSISKLIWVNSPDCNQLTSGVIELGTREEVNRKWQASWMIRDGILGYCKIISNHILIFPCYIIIYITWFHTHHRKVFSNWKGNKKKTMKWTKRLDFFLVNLNQTDHTITYIFFFILRQLNFYCGPKNPVFHCTRVLLRKGCQRDRPVSVSLTPWGQALCVCEVIFWLRFCPFSCMRW